jgi:hypothetical protein
MQTTEKLSITLPTDMAQMVRGKVQTGAYASNSEGHPRGAATHAGAGWQ